MHSRGNRFAWFFAPLVGVACSPPPPAPEAPVLVRVVQVKGGETAATFRASGEVRARVESQLSFRTSGKVVAKLVEVGDHVKAGAPLARLDPQQPRADLAVAAATLAAIRASLGRATLELERERVLLAKEATPRAVVEDREREVAVLTSRLTAAQARYELAREAVGDTELRAAHAGVVTAQDLEVGQPARQGATVFTIADEGPRDAVFRVDENVAAHLHDGTAFTVESVDDAKVRMTGAVREVAPVLERGTASVRVKVTLGGPTPKELALGSPVVATLTVEPRAGFLVPSSSIFSDPHERPSVWVVDPATHAVTLRNVVVHAYESGSVTLRSGIEEGELVVTAGSHRLRPAQVVRLASAQGEPS
jgi:membrane fusion protein, multidrug efflux system